MAAPVVVPLLTNISFADSVTNWAAFKISGTGGGPSAALEADTVLQGTNAISTIANRQRVWLYYDQGTAGTALDFSSGGAEEGQTLYIWANFTNPGFSQTRQGGGFTIALGTNTSNYSEWYVHGNDTYSGGWVRLALDPRRPPSANTGSGYTLSAINFIGVIADVQGNFAKSDNMFVDRIDVGTGLLITDGEASDPADWTALFDADFNSSNKYGIIEKRANKFFLKGEIRIGDEGTASGTCFWETADGSVVTFERPVYDDSNGNLIDAISAPDTYKITVQGVGTSCTFGSVVGSGDARQGIQGGLIDTEGQRWAFDAITAGDDIENLELYGLTFQGCGSWEIDEVGGSAGAVVIGCTFIQCEEIEPNNAEFLNNNVIAPKGRGLRLVEPNLTKQINFIAGSDAVSNITEPAAIDIADFVTPGASSDLNSVTVNASTTALVVCIGWSGSTTDISSVTFLGIGMTRVARATGGNAGSEVWVLFNPPPVTGDVVMNYATAPTVASMGVWQLDNVLDILPVNIVEAGQASASVLNSNLDVESNDSAVLGVIYIDGLGTFTATGDQTIDTQGGIGGNNYAYGKILAGSGRESWAWSWVSAPDDAAMVAVEILPIGYEAHVHVPDAGSDTAEEITFDALKFFGHGAAGSPKWHGENSEATVDLTVLAINEANPLVNEFRNTGIDAAGTVTVENNVTLTVTVQDDAGNPIEDARVGIWPSNDVSESGQIMNEKTTAGGVATELFNYSVDQAVVIKVRKSTVGTRYKPSADIPATITDTGLTITVTLNEDTIARPRVLNATAFDGSVDYFERTGGLIGSADGKQGTVSLWIRPDGITSDDLILATSTNRFAVALSGTLSDVCRIVGLDTGGTLRLDLRSTSAITAGFGVWHHIMASWDLADAAKFHLLLDGADDANSVLHTDFDIDYTDGDIAVGATPAGAGNYDGCLAELWFHPTYIDLSKERNQRKFYADSGEPAPMGDSGEFPLGFAPLLYLNNAFGSFGTNKGTGGDFTEDAGSSVAACADEPPIS